MTTIIQVLTAEIWITISWLLPRPRSGFGLGWSGCVPITITTLIRRSPIIVRRDDDDYKAGEGFCWASDNWQLEWGLLSTNTMDNSEKSYTVNLASITWVIVLDPYCVIETCSDACTDRATSEAFLTLPQNDCLYLLALLVLAVTKNKFTIRIRFIKIHTIM